MLLVGDGAWASPDGSSWRPIAPGPAPWSAVGLVPDRGTVFWIDGGCAFLGTPDGWSTLDIPDGARWIIPDRGGRWAAVGEADGGPRAWRYGSSGWTPLWISLGGWDGLRFGLEGIFECFLGGDLDGELPILVGGSADPTNPTAVAVAPRPGGRWGATRMLRGCARVSRNEAGQPEIYSADGERLTFDGRRWLSAGWAAALRAATPGPGVVSVQIAGDDREIGAVVRRWHEGSCAATIALRGPPDALRAVELAGEPVAAFVLPAREPP